MAKEYIRASTKTEISISFSPGFKVLQESLDLTSQPGFKDWLLNRVRHFRGRVSNFDQSESRKQCCHASDWFNFVTLPRKYRTLLSLLLCC